MLWSNTIHGRALLSRKSIIRNYSLPCFFQVKRIGMVPPLLVLLAKSPLVDEIDISCVKEIIVGAAPVSAQLEQEVISRLGPHVSIRQGLLSRLNSLWLCIA